MPVTFMLLSNPHQSRFSNYRQRAASLVLPDLDTLSPPLWLSGFDKRAHNLHHRRGTRLLPASLSESLARIYCLNFLHVLASSPLYI